MQCQNGYAPPSLELAQRAVGRSVLLHHLPRAAVARGIRDHNLICHCEGLLQRGRSLLDPIDADHLTRETLIMVGHRPKRFW